MVRVGLTGGIGAGKSEVARRLAALGAVIVDADVAARAVVAPGTDGLERVVAAFGPEVLRSDGSLDREALGEIVFADPARRAELNAIVHPLAGAWMLAAEEAAVAAGGPDIVVVHDVPLIAENGLAGMYDKVIVVDVPAEIQLERLVLDRGMTSAGARARVAAQATREQRLAIADLVIDNSGTLADLDRRVREVWAGLRAAQRTGLPGMRDTVMSMTAESPGATGASEPGIRSLDTSIPHPARVYDYFLGGKDNFAADRVAAEAAIKAFPRTAESARASRAFLRRVVRFLAADAGITQFLDIGTGLPSGDNVHQVAQSIVPEARIVYVDNDPVVLLHARALLTSSPAGATAFVAADLREPRTILDEAAKTLDFSQPLALLLLGILHNVGDKYDPYGLVRALAGALPAGSYLAIGHLTADIYPEMTAFAAALNERNLDAPMVLRDHAQVTSFFDGLELVEPGVVQLSKWRPESELEAAAAAALWGGVARKLA